jgi:hypothetical protein
VAPTPGAEGTGSGAAGSVAADEAVATAIESAASETVAASKARIGVRMGVLPSGYPGGEGIRSTLDATRGFEVPGSRMAASRPMALETALPQQEVLPMTVKPLVELTAPAGIAVLGILVIATGWLLIEGLPFVLGCVVMCGLAASAIVLATSHLRDR